MPHVLFDTSVYIAAFRGRDDGAVRARSLASGEFLWLSAVVLEELYVGARGDALKLVERLERDFEKAKRLLVPGQGDWTSAGRVLAKIGERYGFEAVRGARMTNDVLIAMSAARSGVAVVTANGRDFGKIEEFRPDFKWRLAAV